jgi:hypothetical protein
MIFLIYATVVIVLCTYAAYFVGLRIGQRDAFNQFSAGYSEGFREAQILLDKPPEVPEVDPNAEVEWLPLYPNAKPPAAAGTDADDST